jgi:hypothetical protein
VPLVSHLLITFSDYRCNLLTLAPVGWRGSGGLAVATTGPTIWFGGMLLILAGIGEFLLGNNFPMIVFLAYGAHLLSFATTFIPWFNAIGFFNPDGSGIGSPGTSNQSSVFLSSFGKLDFIVRKKVVELTHIASSLLSHCHGHTILHLPPRLPARQRRLRPHLFLCNNRIRPGRRRVFPPCQSQRRARHKAGYGNGCMLLRGLGAGLLLFPRTGYSYHGVADPGSAGV